MFPFFNNYPGTDLHEIDLAYILKTCSEMLERVKAQDDKIAAVEELAQELQDFVNNYFDNLDVQEEINNKIDQMRRNGSLLALIEPTVEETAAADLAEWIAENLTPGTGVIIDASLTVAGAAADAKATGDKITDLKNDLNDIESLFETEQTPVAETAISGYRWGIDGTLIEYSTATAWEFVAEPSTEYIVQGLTVGTNTMMAILFLDASNNIISTISNAIQETGHKVPFKTPSNCVKVKYSTATSATWDAAPLKVSLKPLNGEYTLTWIANEYVVTSTGEFAHYNGWKRTDYLDISGADKVIITNTGTPNSNNCWYDENKNRISYFNNAAGSLVVPANAKYMCLSIEDSADITVRGISAFESEYMPEIPTYYESHIDSKISSIRTLESSGSLTGDKFIFVTDQHYPVNTGNSPSLIQKIMRETGVRFIIGGGDINNNANGVPAMKDVVHGYLNQIKNMFPMLNAVGNHEWYTNVIDPSKPRPTENDLYATMQKYAESEYVSIGPLNSFAFDNTVQKIRYIVVSCDFDTGTTTEQREWFLAELSKIPNGYTLIVIGHAFITDSMTSIRSSHTDFCNGLDALKSRGSYTYNGNTYNYSSKDITVACILTGHTHIDGTILTPGGIRIICTTTDSADLNYTLVGDTPTLSPRTKNTVNEQAFDVFSIDTSAKTINIIRVGYGSDRNYTY